MPTRRLTAIMFADIVGYTAMMQRNETEGLAKVQRFSEVMEKEVQAHKGEILQFQGDGSLSIFDSAVEAMQCAKRIQEQLQQGLYVPLRIGIHIGDIVFTENNIYGDGVNLASRIESLGVPGSILLSTNVRNQIKNKPEFVLSTLGSFDFKNVDEPMEIFALANEGFPIPRRSEMQGKLKQSASPAYLKWIVSAIIVLLIGILLAQNLWGLKNEANTSPKDEHLSIAVLPFRDLSPNGDKEYLSDGISEELLNVLTKVNKLKVASRTSSFVFKKEDRNIQDIAKLLNVDYVLEGSVRKAEDQLRITAQLIDASTDRHIWSETYDREDKNIFVLQDDLARAIVQEVNALVGNDPALPQPELEISTSDQSAYDLYLQAENLREKRGGERGPERLTKQIGLLQQATNQDPEFADAWAALGLKYLNLSTWPGIGSDSIQVLLSKGEIAIQKALELNPTHARAQSIEGTLHSFRYEWQAAIDKLDRSIKIDPWPEAKFNLAITYLALGYIDRTISILREAIESNPLNADYYAVLGIAYSSKRQYDLAKKYLIKARVLGYPSFLDRQFIPIYLAKDQLDEIDFLLATNYGPDSISPLIPHLTDIIVAKGNQRTKAIETFWVVAEERGYAKPDLLGEFWMYLDVFEASDFFFNIHNSSTRLGWAWSSRMDRYRKSKYFKNYIREAKVYAYWKAHGFPPQCRDLGNGDFECE